MLESLTDRQKAILDEFQKWHEIKKGAIISFTREECDRRIEALQQEYRAIEKSKYNK